MIKDKGPRKRTGYSEAVNLSKKQYDEMATIVFFDAEQQFNEHEGSTLVLELRPGHFLYLCEADGKYWLDSEDLE